jgi:thiol-disulfide isomerase/thioredoxin
MKKITLPLFCLFGSLLLTAGSIPAVAQTKPSPPSAFLLSGKITGMHKGYVHLSYQNPDGSYRQDSTVIVNGGFHFSGNITEPTMAYLYASVEDGGRGDREGGEFFLEPNTMQLSVPDRDFKNAVLTGSRTQSEYRLLQQKLNKLENRWKVVMDTLTAANKRSNFEYQALKDWVLVPYFAEYIEICTAFFNTHPASYVTAFELQFEGRELSTDSLKMFYNRFPAKLKTSKLGKGILTEIERRKIGVPGTRAQDFVTMDVNGNKLALSDFKGKAILLDFWASWCLPCRKSSPHVKSLYATYKDKGLAVIGIADDERTPDAWRKAIIHDSVDVWPNILDGNVPRESEEDGNVSPKSDKDTPHPDILKKYGVDSFPTKILIGKDGVIIGRYGEGPADEAAMDNKLAEIFR